MTNEYSKRLNSKLTLEEIQKAIDLTTKQKQAVQKFKDAVKQCEKAGVCFYTVLDSINFLNGRNVDDVIYDTEMFNPSECKPDNQNLQKLIFPSLRNVGFSGFADDTHWVFIKSRVAERILSKRSLEESE